jgi:hypothetical protein
MKAGINLMVLFLIFLLLLEIPVLLGSGVGTEFSYNSKGKRDPFIPWKQSGGDLALDRSPADFNIEGIIFDPVRGSFAVVNGAVVKEGAEVNGYKVVKIDRNGLVLSRKDQSIRLPFPTE